MTEKCPVDHTKPAECPVDHKKEAKECPVDHKQSAESESCPVDHTAWAKFNGGEGLPPLPGIPEELSGDREISSIPRADKDSNWVYPSQQQFYSAMTRKNQNPHAQDMKVVVPIHNIVNERAWAQILDWEKGYGGEKCGGPKLVRFEGDSKKLTPKARLGMLMGNTKPFDRHDWVVDRCGQQIDYVIDFYSGAPDPAHPERPSFYLDARPKLNSFEGAKMRFFGLFGL